MTIHRATLIEYSLLVRSSTRVAFCRAVCVLALDAVLGRIETRYCTTGEGLFHGRKTVHVSTCCIVVPICFGPRRITFFLPALHVYIAPYI